MLFAHESIYFLAGSAYDKSILPMQIIMPTLLFIGLTNIMGIQMLVPLGKEKYVLYSEIAGAIVDLVLNAILIPFMGAAGAAIGTLAAEAVVWICLLYTSGNNPFDKIIKRAELEKVLENTDIIVPKKRHYFIETLYSHYAHTHYASHLDITRDILNKKCPEYLPAFDKVMKRSWGYMFNMMIMKRNRLRCV